jgi:hypothetical protein
VLVGFATLVGPVAGFAAIWTEVLDGFAVAVFGVVDAATAVIAIVGFCRRRSGEKKKATESQGRESCFAEGRTESGDFHKASKDRAQAGFGMMS